MTEHLAEVIDLFKPRMTPERREHLQRRVADMAIEIALLVGERERLKAILKQGGEDE